MIPESTSPPSSSRQSRKYESPLRTEQAARTRQRILDAAASCFIASGYVTTTMPAIAAAAGVSVETVNSHGPKAALLFAAFDKAFAFDEGHGSIHHRPQIARAGAEIRNQIEFIRFACDFVADAAERSAKLWLVMYHASTTDTAIKDAFDELSTRVRADTVRLVELVADRGPVRTDRDHQLLSDELELLYFPTGYERLVEVAEWSLDEYREYLFVQTCRILLPGDP